MKSAYKPRLRIAAIRFLNPAPLMWDFEHPPLCGDLSARYQLDWMLPAECADRLADGAADIGLLPIAALATTPGIRVLPGCTIASKGSVRSLLLVRRAQQPIQAIGSVAADTASRTTVAHARILFHLWGNPDVPFLPMAANLDSMLARADAAIVIGDPALMALEEQPNRYERTGEQLVYHDLAAEWRAHTGLPFVSAVWGAAQSAFVAGGTLLDQVTADVILSRDHGRSHIDELAREWAARLPLSTENIHTYLTRNIHYILDEECLEGMRGFFRIAAELGVLPPYELPPIEPSR